MGVFQGLGPKQRGRGPRDAGQKAAASQPRGTVAAGEGAPARRGRHGARGPRRAARRPLPVGCTPPPPSRAPRCVRAGPSPTPGPRCGCGAHGARPPLPAGPREPPCNLCSQPSPSPTRRARVCASSFPSSLPRAWRTPRSQAPGSGLLYSAAEGPIHTQTVPLSPESPLGREPRGACRPDPRVPLHLPFTLPLGICGRSRGGGKCCFALQKEENFATQLETCATRVTSRETRTGTACGSDLASDEPVGGRGNEPGAHADRHPSLPRGGRRPEVPAPPSLPAQVPTRCLQGKDSGDELAAPGGRRTGARLGRRTAFQERATRN